MFNLKKHIALLFLFALLVPSAIQVAHAFENHHEHIVCKSVNEQHLHELEVDCANLHLQLETFSSERTSGYDVIPQHFYFKNFNEQPQQIQVVYTPKKSSRGPPFLLIK